MYKKRETHVHMHIYMDVHTQIIYHFYSTQSKDRKIKLFQLNHSHTQRHLACSLCIHMLSMQVCPPSVWWMASPGPLAHFTLLQQNHPSVQQGRCHRYCAHTPSWRNSEVHSLESYCMTATWVLTSTERNSKEDCNVSLRRKVIDGGSNVKKWKRKKIMKSKKNKNKNKNNAQKSRETGIEKASCV